MNKILGILASILILSRVIVLLKIISVFKFYSQEIKSRKFFLSSSLPKSRITVNLYGFDSLDEVWRIGRKGKIISTNPVILQVQFKSKKEMQKCIPNRIRYNLVAGDL